MSNLKSFKSFTEERIKGVVITFGRFQPSTTGHSKLIDKVSSIADGNNYRIYTSQTHDNKKNPLSYEDKIRFMRKIFPKHGRNIIEDTTIHNIFDALVKLHKQRFTQVTLVVGSDRINEFDKLLHKYNGVAANHGYYNFVDGIKIVSSGDRDPDADDVSGMSASKVRDAAAKNDFDTFSKGLPKDFKEKVELFKAIRSGLGLKESIQRKHIQLDSVSEQREDFVKGSLFSVGDSVQINETSEIGTVKELGTNYVSIDINGITKKKWITSITKI